MTTALDYDANCVLCLMVVGCQWETVKNAVPGLETIGHRGSPQYSLMKEAQRMPRQQFRLMDMLLLTAPAQDAWALRSKNAIEQAVLDQYHVRIQIPEDRLDRIVEPGWIRCERNSLGFLFIVPTPNGAEEYFSKQYRVGRTVDRDRPFAAGTIEALAHWFDEYFSPKSQMNARLAELDIPGARLGGGTKWREAAWLFEQWNQAGRFSYISALIVHLLDPEQWPGAEDRRQRAWSEIETIFRPSGLRLHDTGYLVPALQQEQAEPRPDAWGDERRFRDEVVEPMLRQVPGIINVISTHGNDEFGRDFIFDYRHPLLGDRRWVGVQVKVGDVSGAAGGPLRALLDQVQMMFEHPMIDLGTMGRVAMSEVIIVTSGRYTSNAQERILDGIRDPVWRTNVFFLDRDGVKGILNSARRAYQH